MPVGELKAVTCKQCERIFLVPRLSHTRLCSDECRILRNRALNRKWYHGNMKKHPDVVKCGICGGEFQYSGAKRYCSAECARESKLRHTKRLQQKRRAYYVKKPNPSQWIALGKHCYDWAIIEERRINEQIKIWRSEKNGEECKVRLCSE